MVTRHIFFFLLQAVWMQNSLSQVLPLQNGCVCQKLPGPQNQLINLQNANNLQLPAVTSLQLNNALANQLTFTSLPNVPFGQQTTVVNNQPLNLPTYNNVPLPNNLPNLVPNALPYNLQVGNRYNNQPVQNNLPLLNNVQFANNLPLRNNLPSNIPNIQQLNLPVNCLNTNGLPINLLNGCIQLANANLPPINNAVITSNLPGNRVPNVNLIQGNNLPVYQPNNIQLSNLPVIPQNNIQVANLPRVPQNLQVNNLPFIPPNNVQVANVPFNQPNNIQLANLPYPNKGIQLNALPNSQQLLPNLPANRDCGCNQSGLSLLVENGLAGANGNSANNVPLVSLNGLQLGGLGGLGNLPLFNGLPVIGVTESVVNLNNPCNCQK